MSCDLPIQIVPSSGKIILQRACLATFPLPVLVLAFLFATASYQKLAVEMAWELGYRNSCNVHPFDFKSELQRQQYGEGFM